MHEITSKHKTTLRIETWDIYDNYRAISYDNFNIQSAHHNYALSLGTVLPDSNITDTFTSHSGAQFSTVDRDNDKSATNCAKYHSSGWWFTSCYQLNLNGNYYVGMMWHNGEEWVYLKRTRMAVRDVQ
jgi:ficolin